MNVELFSTWVPFDLVKGNPNGGDEEPMVGKITGIASAETTDQQGETLVQAGVDWSYLLSKGWLNDEHKAGADNVLGEVTAIRPTILKGVPATAIDGLLYLHKPRAKEIYRTAQAMQKAGTGRRLGFSVEGEVLLRDDRDRKRIIKSRVMNLAVTAHPVHADARLETLVRSMAAIGYPTPAYVGSGLGALVPQDLEGSVATGTYGAISRAHLESMIRQEFPTLSQDELQKLMNRLLAQGA